MERAHEVAEVRFAGDQMILVVDGRKHEIRLVDCSRKLLEASAEARARFVVSGSGYGIHWPDLDEDLSIDRLVGAAAEKPPFTSGGRGKRSRGARPDRPRLDS